MMRVSELQFHQTNKIRPAGIQPGTFDKSTKIGTEDTQKSSFQDVLNERIGSDNSLRFSSHAAKRIRERNIDLSPSHLSRLEDGLSRVKEKGGRSSLLLMDDLAYVVSVKNQTVVTALSQEAAQRNVFTNIDSVAIV